MVWNDNIGLINIVNKDELEASIIADMKYIINHAKTIEGGTFGRDKCKIPILESRNFSKSDSQKFGIEHKTSLGVGRVKEIYQIGKFEKNFKSDPSGMAEIIQDIFNNNSTYDYDEKTSILTKTSDNPPTTIDIHENIVFIDPINFNIKENCDDSTGPDPTFRDTLLQP